MHPAVATPVLFRPLTSRLLAVIPRALPVLTLVTLPLVLTLTGYSLGTNIEYRARNVE